MHPNRIAAGTSFDSDFIPGMAKTEGSVKILLDIDQILSRDEVTLLEEVA